MRYYRLLSVSVLAVLTTLASMGQAEDKPAKDNKIKPSSNDNPSGIHQMVILQGPNRTVHYFSQNGSPGEQAALRALERADNESAYADALQDLRRQYVSTEAALEARRRQVQLNLYGIAFENSTSSTLTTNTPGLSYEGIVPLGGFGYGYGNGYGDSPYGPISGEAFSLKTDSKVSRSLAHGIGDEGRFKNEMIAQIAKQATPEYAAAAARAHENALGAVAGAVHTRSKDQVGFASFDQMKPRRASVILKDKEKITGLLIREDSEWVVIRTEDSEIRVRTAEVARISLELPK